ncbi:unnamed protein product, partial [Durusdinium trenchii]
MNLIILSDARRIVNFMFGPSYLCDPLCDTLRTRDMFHWKSPGGSPGETPVPSRPPAPLQKQRLVDVRRTTFGCIPPGDWNSCVSSASDEHTDGEPLVHSPALSRFPSACQTDATTVY